LGCEIVDKYIDVAKLYFPVIKFDMTNIDNYMMFADNSYDIVMAIDVLEHIEFSHAHKIIVQMQRIARKKVIIYTPSKFELNEKNIENAWGLGKNPNQEHKSFINSDYLHNVMGFQRITFPKPDKNTLAIWEKKK
jgi:predicted SAM-dependent methyltransferase